MDNNFGNGNEGSSFSGGLKLAGEPQVQPEQPQQPQQPQVPRVKYCKHCGAELPVDLAFCTKCGAPQ